MSWKHLFTKEPKVIKAELPMPAELLEGSIETGSYTWMFMRKWATENLNKARIQNDSIKKDTIYTAFTRGQISVYKKILSLPEESAKPKFQPEHFDAHGDAGY